MSQYVVLQVSAALPEGATMPDPLMLTAWLTEADDEASAVESMVDRGIISVGTIHALAIDAAQSFDVTVNPVLKPSEATLAPGPPIELGPGDVEQIPIPIPIDPDA